MSEKNGHCGSVADKFMNVSRHLTYETQQHNVLLMECNLVNTIITNE